MDQAIRLVSLKTSQTWRSTSSLWSDNMGADGADGGNLRAAKGLVMGECDQKKKKVLTAL